MLFKPAGCSRQGFTPKSGARYAIADIPTVPGGSPACPRDVAAALSEDGGLLILSVVDPSEDEPECSPRITRVKLRGTGKLWQMATPRVKSSKRAGHKVQVRNR